MTTALADLEVYFMVYVDDDPNFEKRYPGYRRRYEFRGEDAEARATACYESAVEADFRARLERVARPRSQEHSRRFDRSDPRSNTEAMPAPNP